MPTKQIQPGTKFDRLMVISHTGPLVSWTGHKYPRTLCKCACGSECKIQNSHLRSGQIRSCGCLRRDRAAASYVKRNKE